MIQCYDWDKNILDFEDVNKNRYYLKLKGNKTIVGGESATGKSLLCSILQDYIEDENEMKKYDTQNVFVANRYTMEKIKEQAKKLILIDRADIRLNKDIVEYINNDTNVNRYIIFLRKPIGLYVSPNYFAILKNKDNVLYLEYLFNVKGWN